MEEEKRTKVQIRLRQLRQEVLELGNILCGGDPDLMQTLDAWFDAVREIEEIEYGTKPPFVSSYVVVPKNMVVLCGKDWPLIEDYLDDTCKLIVPEEAYRQAGRAMM